LFVAAPAQADSTQAAQVLFEEGRKLMGAGDLVAACPKFAESQKLDPGAGTLLNLALCYEKSERFASAWSAYTEAASQADRGGRAQWLKRSKDKAAALAPVLSTLTVVVPPGSKVEGLEIKRDGTKLAPGEWGVKVPIDGGEHVIEASAPNHSPWQTRVTAAAQRDVVKVEVPVLTRTAAAPAPAVAPAPQDKPPVETSTGSTQRILGIVAGSAGIIALGVGGYFGLQAQAKHEDALPNCTPDGRRDYDAAHQAADISTIAVVAGAVLLAGGVVLYLTAPRGSRTTATAVPRFAF
jgi:hypothetical protein